MMATQRIRMSLNNCQPARCGDGVLSYGRRSSFQAICGDGFVGPGEGCDDDGGFLALISGDDGGWLSLGSW